MRTATLTKTNTYTKLAIATLVILGAGALAYALFPPTQPNSSTNEPAATCQGTMGDLNGSGKLDNEDETILKQMIAGNVPSNACGDMDGDGYVAPGDLTKFQIAKNKQDTPLCTNSDRIESDPVSEKFYSGYVVTYDKDTEQYVTTYDSCRNIADGPDLLTGQLLIEANCSAENTLNQDVITCPSGCKNRMCKPEIDDTRTFACKPKPEIGTKWNSVSYYEQYWSDTKWLPIASATLFNETSSTSACRYNCIYGYQWDANASACIPAPIIIFGQVNEKTSTDELVLAGSSNVLMAGYKFFTNSATAKVTVNNLQIRLADSASAMDIKAVKISYTNINGETITKTGVLADNIVTFSGLDFFVDNGESHNILSILADLTAVEEGATLGDNIKLCLDTDTANCDTGDLINFSALSSSGEELTIVHYVNNSALDDHFLRATILTPNFISPGGQASPGQQSVIGKIRFSSKSLSGRDSTLTSMVLRLDGSYIGKLMGDNSVPVKIYKNSIDAQNLIGETKFDGVDAKTSKSVEIKPIANNIFPQGIDILIVVDTTDSDFYNTYNPDTLKVTLEKYLWNDGGVLDAYPLPQNEISSIPYLY